MKIIIDIPKEFEEHFKVDRFEDSLARIESDIESFGLLAGRYEQETITMLREVIKNGTILPKGHGRLIDADSLIKAIEEKAKRLSNADTINGLCGAVALIFDAPTIIEVDKESDTDE